MRGVHQRPRVTYNPFLPLRSCALSCLCPWPAPSRALKTLTSYWAQLTEAMRGMAALGLAHGDLSPFNLLATEDRLVLIDLLAYAF